MKKTLLYAMLLLLVMTAQAQEKEKKVRMATLYGQVYDSFTKNKLKAHITLMREDSTVVDTISSRPNRVTNYSYFSFKIPLVEGKYIIKATADGYEDLCTDYTLKRQRYNLSYGVPNIYMKKAIHRSYDLDGVEVVGTRIQMAYRGDTIVYDAAAFNIPEGSMLDELVRQLPGAELKDNGDIYVNGKKVDYLTLNGTDFFKGKNKMMLDNLPYYTVKDIKVYNKMTEQSKMVGRDIEERDFVMDVNLKREYARGYIANAEAGAGTEDRWMARLFGLYYDDNTRLAVFANANNVNETRKPGADGEWSPSKQSKSLVTTHQAGLHLENQDKDKKYHERLDATLEWNDKTEETNRLHETFATSGNIFNRRYSLSNVDDLKFEASNIFYINRKLYTDIEFTYGKEDMRRYNADSTYVTSLTNRTVRNAMGKNEYWRFQGVFDLYKIWETGDRFNINFRPYVHISKPDITHDINQTYYAANGKNDVRNNYTDRFTKNYQGASYVSYYYRLPDSWEIGPAFNYVYQYSHARNSLYRLDSLDNAGQYDELGVLPSTREAMLQAFDAQNSFDEEIHTQQFVPQFRIQRSSGKSFFYLSLPWYFNKEKTDYRHAALDTTAHRSWSSFQPNLFFMTTGKKRIDVQYSTSLRQPSMRSLMPVYNNSNPLAIYINNPNVKGSRRHDLKAKLNIKCDSIDLSYWLGIEGRLTNDAQGTRTNYNTTTGAYTYITDNVDKPNWFGQLTAGINGTFDKKRRLRYSLDGRVKYERSVDFDIAYDNEAVALSKVNTTIAAATAKLTYRLGKLTVGTTGKLTARHSNGNRDNFQEIDVYDFQYGMNLQYTIPVLQLNFSTDMNNFCRRGYNSDNMNTDELIWNAQLSRSFFKGKLTAKLTAYDLLKKLSTVSYGVDAQGRTETWYRSVPRYVMLSLAYKFNKKPNKK